MNIRSLLLGLLASHMSLAAAAHEATGTLVESDGRLAGPGAFPLGWSQPGEQNSVVEAAPFQIDLGSGITLTGPGFSVRRLATINAGAQGLTLAAIRAAGRGPDTAVLRLVYEIEGLLSMGQATQRDGLSADSAPAICGSQSFLSLFGGVSIGESLVFGLRASMQDDPFHFRFLDPNGAGIGCLGRPAAWTSDETASMEARFHLLSSVELWSAVRYEQQRVTAQINPEAYSLGSGHDLQALVGVSIRG